MGYFSKSTWYNALGLSYQIRFLHFSIFLQIRTNNMINFRCIRHNEIKEYDKRHHHCDEPDDPEDYRIALIKSRSYCNDSEVARGYSESLKDVADEQADLSVFFVGSFVACISWLRLIVVFIPELTRDLNISQTNHTIHQRKE